MLIQNCDFPTRLKNTLIKEGIQTTEFLYEYPLEDLYYLRGIRDKYIFIIKEWKKRQSEKN